MYSKLLEFQKKVSAISKDSTNPFYNSKYFDINSLIEHIKPLLNEFGWVLNQPLDNVNGRPAIKTILTDGTDKIESCVTLPDLQDPQKMGSAITYYRRYAIQSLLLLQADDDDANKTIKVDESKSGVQTQENHPFKTCPICKQSHSGKYDKCFDCWKKENGK